MSDELNLVRDLAVILVSAGIFTIISKALKQPLILGYIIAGFLVGPHISFFPGIGSQETVEQWSEIGMIFLMFGLGLEFSFKKLLKVGSSAIVAALTKFVGVFIIGFVTAQAMSWTLMESIFLGGLLSMSSTMVVIKSYDDMGLKEKPYAGMVFGTLVVEDLIAILLMVLLSTMAVSQSFAGKELLMNILKLVFFIILWFLVGIYVIPTILKKTGKYLNSEILLIVSIGLCLGMVVLAQAVGFSSALGAFVMGSILAETIQGEQIDKTVEPLKNMFGAIFFVSVGMMVDPAVILQHWVVILIITIIVIVSHIVFAAAGIILTGKGLDNAVHAGFSLAQLGEFGFILASLGCSLGVMRGFIYPVIISVSVITTFLTPYVIKLGTPCYELIKRKLPQRFIDRIEQGNKSSKVTAAEESEWKKLLTAYFLRIVLYGVIIIAIFIGSKLYLAPLASKLLPSATERLHKIIMTACTLVLMSPFIYGLGISAGSINVSAKKLLAEKESNIWPLMGLVLARSFLAVGVVLGVISANFDLAGWTILAIIIAGVAFTYFGRKSVHKFSILENRFMQNYNAREESEKKKKPVSTSIKKELESYNVFTRSFTISADSAYAGMPIKEIPFRQMTGVNLVKISRGSSSIVVPSGDEKVYPYDRILAVGTKEQLDALGQMLFSSEKTVTEYSDDVFRIEPVTLSDESFLTGKTLRHTDLRKYHCMIISILHEGQFITNPSSDYEFEEGDTVWIAGDIKALGWI